jgi:inositol-phosphate phosphatase/L-galactose 1-phosphate phosphatase/histidinol-phosphatase
MGAAGPLPADHDLMALAERLADASGPLIRRYFRQPIRVDEKADSTPVTAADREAETTIREILARECPDHGVVGEEFGADRPDAEFVWVLDPVDGTRSFVTGKPLFGTLIALVRQGRPVLGVVDMPALEERFVGALGRPSTFRARDGSTRELRCRPCPALASAILSATTPHMFQGAEAAAFERLRLAAKAVVYGADCYAYCLLAMGTLDLVVEADMGIHDYLALVPIVEAAGGVASDWQGRALGFASGRRVLFAGDRRVHEAALGILRI